jgi:autotransporter-associated beta strand protein
MTFHHLRRSTGKKFLGARRRPVRSVDSLRPRVEWLEDRTTPAAHTWNPAGADALWSNPANWSAGGAPAAGETAVVLTFPPGTNTTSTNDVANLTVDQMTLLGSGYVLGGAAVTFADTASLSTTNAAGNNEVDLPATLAAPLSVTVTAAGTTLTLGGTVGGGSGLIKEGAGTLAITSTANSYTGPTTVNAGTLLVDGALAAASNVSVADGGTLAGTGVVNGKVFIDAFGALAPGDPSGPGTLTTGSITFNPSSRLAVRINGPAPGSFDVLQVNGSVELLGVSLVGSVGFTPTPGQSFLIIDSRSIVNLTGSFFGGNRVHIGSQAFSVNYAGGDFNDAVITAVGSRTWTGLGADNNWTTAANWAGNVAPVAGDDLVFAGTNRPTPNNDYPANTPFGTITFASGGFNLEGNPVLLNTDGGGIDNATGDDTVSLDVALSTVAQAPPSSTGQTLTMAAGTTLTLAGEVTGVGGLSKEGAGTLKWVSDSNSSGGVAVNAGTLLLTAKLAGSAVSVSDGGTLAGTGSMWTLTMYGGTVSPGVNPGDTAVLTVAFLVRISGGTIALDFRGANGSTAPYTPGTDYDQLNAGGVELLPSGGTLQVALGVDTIVGASFVPIHTSGGQGIVRIYGDKFNDLDEGGILPLNGQRFQLSYAGNGGKDVVLTHVNTPRPVSGSVTAAPAGPVVAGISTVTLSGTVGSDPDPLDTLESMTVLWGDGTTTPLAPVTGAFSAAHVYAAPGSYPIRLEIVKDGNATATTLFTTLDVRPNLSPNERFVSEAFVALLGRDPDANDLSAFAALLDQGYSRLQFVTDIQHTPEYYYHTVDSFYRDILGRAADATGLQGGALFLAAGGPQDKLKAILYGSPEYLEKVGGTTDAFLTAMFPDLTGQPLDATTQGLLNDQLSVEVSRSALALDLLRTPAASQAQVNQCFATYLGRQPGPAEMAVHSGYIQATNAPELDLAVILASDEFFNGL